MNKLRTDQATMTSADEANTDEDESRNSMPDPVVLTCLFDSCDLSDLPLFRQVSSLWDSLSVDRFRNEMTVIIRVPPSVNLEVHHRHVDNPDRGLEWETANKEFRKLKGKPFRNFRILYIEFNNAASRQRTWRSMLLSSISCGGDGDSNRMRKNMRQFFGEFGSWIRKLELCHIQVNSVEAFKRAIFEETPNLEELRLGEIDNKSGPASDNDENQEGAVKMQPNLKQLVVKSVLDLPITWNLLLSSFPNLLFLEVDVNYAPVADVQRYFTNIYQLLPTKKQCKFIAQGLSLKAWTSDEIRTAIEVLQTPNLTLYKMSLNTEIVEDGDGAALVRLLFSTAFRLHGSTLECLFVFLTNGNGSQRLENFPCHPGPFNTIKSLLLSGNLCKTLHFLEHFPNLTFLGLLEAGGDIVTNSDSGRMDKLKLHKLNNAILEMERDLYITREEMELLVKLMPNVKMFDGNLSNMSLRVLCREWRNLKVLAMSELVDREDQNTTLDDEGITGIVAGSDLRMPNITDLQDLECLIIKQRANVGDDSVWNGFLQLPQLEELEVELAFETSEAAFEALATKFPGGVITRRQAEG